jgi:hypothetical protein
MACATFGGLVAQLTPLSPIKKCQSPVIMSTFVATSLPCGFCTWKNDGELNSSEFIGTDIPPYKPGSAELSGSINSMFQWYMDAKVCYVFL